VENGVEVRSYVSSLFYFCRCLLSTDGTVVILDTSLCCNTLSRYLRSVQSDSVLALNASFDSKNRYISPLASISRSATDHFLCRIVEPQFGLEAMTVCTDIRVFSSRTERFDF